MMPRKATPEKRSGLSSKGLNLTRRRKIQRIRVFPDSELVVDPAEAAAQAAFLLTASSQPLPQWKPHFAEVATGFDSVWIIDRATASFSGSTRHGHIDAPALRPRALELRAGDEADSNGRRRRRTPTSTGQCFLTRL